MLTAWAVGGIVLSLIGHFRTAGGAEPDAEATHADDLVEGAGGGLTPHRGGSQSASSLRPCRMPLTAATTANTTATTGWPRVHQPSAAAEKTAISTSALPNVSMRKTAFGETKSAHARIARQRRPDADEHARPRQRERQEAPDAERDEGEELEEEAEDVVRPDLRRVLLLIALVHNRQAYRRVSGR